MDDTLFGGVSRPKIGIRAIVDGRDSLRKIQEEPISKLAQQVCCLLKKYVFYADGQSVECVLGSSVIGNGNDAAKVAAEFKQQNVVAIINIARTWSYPAEIMHYDSRVPQAFWGFSGSNAPGTVFMGAAVATAAQEGMPFFKIYGQDIQDCDDLTIPDDVAQKLILFTQCAIALGTMYGRTYLCLGTVCMGIGSSVPDKDFFRAYLGMRVQNIDMTEILRRIEMKIYDEDEYETARKWVKENCVEMSDPNPETLILSSQQKEKAWDISTKMALIFRDLMDGNHSLRDKGFLEESQGYAALTASFQGQRQWTDWMPASDFAESILNSGFDWNGEKRPHPIATENDSLQAVTLLFGFLLTGTAQIFCDVRGYWSKNALYARFGKNLPAAENGFIYLTNSGPAALDGSMGATTSNGPGIKPYWELTKADRDNCMRKIRWGAVKRAVFRGGGFSVSYRAAGGVPMTMIRLNLVKGLGPVLQFVEGSTIELSNEMAETIAARTDPTWPQIFFVPRLTQRNATSSVYQVMNHWGSNHCTLCYGHIGEQLITLASMLRIPVCMHNLEADQIFRPDAWNQFGADDPVGADYRACAVYGPLYGPY